jgi:hypothetical protein
MSALSVETKKIIVTKYDVYAFCRDCNACHPIGIQVPLNDGPRQVQSIGNAYAGKEVPWHVAMLVNNCVRCPNGGHLFVQKDNKQIFLVPVRG